MLKSEDVCVVAERKVSLNDIRLVGERQRNCHNPNNRVGEEDAFDKTLRGSKIFLKELAKNENMEA